MEKETAEIFVAELRAMLGDYVKESGHIFYSNYKTLKKGKFYILGVNPGGAEEKYEDGTIDNSFKLFLRKDYNEYYVNWYKYTQNDHPVQKNLKYLSKEILDFDLRDICASNLLFNRSATQSSMNTAHLDKCFAVHQKIIAIVQPEILLTFGGFTLWNLKKRFEQAGKKVTNIQPMDLPSGHGDWTIKYYQVADGKNQFKILNFPHLSRYTMYCSTPKKIQAMKILKEVLALSS